MSANGRIDPERSGAHQDVRKRGAFRALIQDFEPVWFTWCMNAGIIGILLHQLPYQFPGIGILSTIAFLIDFALFIVFSILMLLRFATFREQAYHECVQDPATLALFACWPIAWLTLVSFVTLTVTEAHWGGYPWSLVAYVMWWIGAAWILANLLFFFFTLINRHEVYDQQLPFFVIIPAVGASTLATVGGLVTSYAVDLSASLAVPIIIASFHSVGVGILLAVFLYTLLFHQLLAKGWPPASKAITTFLFVGPTGQSAAALQLLGSASSTYGPFGGINRGAFLTPMAASQLDSACILIALMLNGLGLIWIVFAFYSAFYRAFRKEITWSPAWNSTIFPMGTYATSTLLFSIEMNSPFYRVITSIIVVFLVLMFFVNLSFTIWEVAHGKLLIVRDNPRVKLEQEEEKKD